MTSSGDAKFSADKMLSLVGGQITEIVVSGDEDEVSWGFVIERQAVPGQSKFSKKICWVDCDPESNGPGFIHIEEWKDESSATASG